MNLRFIISMLLLSFFCTVVYSQKTDTTYFNADWKVSSKESSTFYRLSKTIEEGKKYEIADYFNSGQIQMRGAFSSLSPEVKDGDFIWYYDNGQKKMEASYAYGRLKSARYWDENGQEKKAPDYKNLEKQPTFPGGMDKLYKYIGANFVYPKGITPRPKGTIKISFVVDKDGSISKVQIIEALHPLLDAEAIRVVKQMPKWEPGIQDGKPVRVAYNIPISMK